MSDDNYSYVVARVRSRKKFLLDEDDYQNLVRMGTNEIARFMEETEYEKEINELGARYSGSDLIERALYRNISRHFSDLLGWCEGELEDMVSNYLRRYDSWNIKTALRGIYTDSTDEEIRRDFIPAGVIDEKRLLGHQEIEELIEELLDTIFGEPLNNSYMDFEETGLLTPLENAVSKTFYENIIKEQKQQGQAEPKQAYYEQITSEIDLLNIRNALRASESIPIEDYFVEGGTLTKEEINQAIQNTEALEDILVEYGAEDIAQEIRETGSLSKFDSKMDEILIEYGRKMSNKYPLSIAPIFSYILSKENEIKRIRAIAHGKEYGLSTEEIEEMIT